MKQYDATIRVATPEDAEDILAIYAPYVENTAITFEYDVPNLQEFRERIISTLQTYPYLVAERDGCLTGYAYTGAFSNRAAYAWSAETSIYIRQDCRHMGIGKKLYEAIEAISKAQHITNLNACITCPTEEDTYVTKNSVQFHTHLGYSLAGTFHNCGYKFGRWYNVVWMEKFLFHHPAIPSHVIPFPDIQPSLLMKQP